MASKPGALSKFPWQDLGDYKYALLVPFFVAPLLNKDDDDHWCWHMSCIIVARYIMAQVFLTLSRLHAITKRSRIQGKGISFAQVDREDHWDDFILLQTYVATAVHWLPYLNFQGFPLWDAQGLKFMVLWHIGPAELVYYWLHRALHHHYLYQRYHSHHHASFVTEPITGSVHPFAEHLLYTAVFAIPLLGPFFQGHASLTMFYTYMIGFDVLNMMGHCNWEFVPRCIMGIPGMKYLLYTPSYHSLHHSRIHCNFCLFMPLYDAMFGTVNWQVTDTLYDKASQGQAVHVHAPNVVFVGHGTTLTSAFHAPFALRSFSSRPFVEHWYLKLLWPICAVIAILVRLFGQPYTHDRHKLKHLTLETWVTPAFAIQYFFPSQWQWINDKIESAIVDANDSGVQVIGLGALNKNEALNGGGKLFVDKLGDELKVRVVHGNTLTAAAVLQKIPNNATEVFVTGATSKLGRAISLYLAERRGVKVVMYTRSQERFEKIRDEASDDAKHLLVHATKMEAGAHIRDWIVGKFCRPKDQAIAPSGTTFHQFVVPPLQETRKSDCVYTILPAFQLPKETKDFKTCEMTMQRNCVHACHAGAIVHALEKWDHHEVGAIDYTRIDATWEASVKHGLVLQ